MESTQNLSNLLENLQLPLGKLQLNFQAEGIYCFPEEWKQTDDANPTYFQYQIKFGGLTLNEGKIQPRQQTEKELKLIEEELQAKQQKKQGKKDTKGKFQDDLMQPTPEELEQQRILQEKQEEEERKFQEEWDALDEDTKFYRTYEDQFKHPCIKFQTDVNSIEKNGGDLTVFLERLLVDGGDFLYVLKVPILPEEELAKLRKQKPKNLNLQDLNPLILRAFVSLEPFKDPQTQSHTYRVFLQEQLYDTPELEPETPKPNIEKTYVLLTLSFQPHGPCFVPPNVQPTCADIIPKPDAIIPIAPNIQCVNEYKATCQVVFESLAIEFSNMFGKELIKELNFYSLYANTLDQMKDPRKKVISYQEREEIKKKNKERRKDTFLYDFNISGKYKILKERVKKTLVNIAKDRFKKIGSFTGITTELSDQFYSVIYAFLVEKMRETLNDMVKEKREELHHDVIIGYEQTLKERDFLLLNITNESNIESVMKLVKEYEIINKLFLVERNYQKLLKMDAKNPEIWQTFALFCLRNKNQAKAEDSLMTALKLDPQNKDYLMLGLSLLIRRGKYKEAIVFGKFLLQKYPQDLLINLLLAFLFKFFVIEEKIHLRYFVAAQRIYMRQLDILQPISQYKQNPIISELPHKIKNDAAIEPATLSPEEIDSMWLQLMQYFANNSLFELVAKGLNLLTNKTTVLALIMSSKKERFQGNYKEALEIQNKLLETDDKNYDVLIAKGMTCYLTQQFEECEKTFYRALKTKKGTQEQNFETFLRLGYMFINKQSWVDARIIFSKACEMKGNSPLAWLGLGIACFRCQRFEDSEVSLNQANLYDPFNFDIWGYIVLCNLLKPEHNFFKANQAMRELLKCTIDSPELLIEIGDAFNKLSYIDTAIIAFKTAYSTLLQQQKQSQQLFQIIFKLGEIYVKSNQLVQAKKVIDQASELIQNEGDSNIVKNLSEIIKNQEKALEIE